MPIKSFNIFTDTGEKFGPEMGPKFGPEMGPDNDPGLDGLPQDPFPSDDPLSIHDPLPPPPPRKPGAAGNPVPIVTKQVEREVRQELDALVRLMALAWSVPDPECAGVLNEQSKAIAEGLTGVLRHNPRLLASLRGTGWLGDWVSLAMALTPVIRAIYGHHIATPPPVEETPNGFDPTAPVIDYAAWIPRTGNGAPDRA